MPVRLSAAFLLGLCVLVATGCNSGGSPSSAPTQAPILAPTSVATTQPVGAAGSTLTFPTVQGSSATLIVPPEMAQPGAVATLTSAIGALPGGPTYVYGIAIETFALSLNVKAGFHSPALTLTVPPNTGGAFGITVFSSGGDYYMFPANSNPLVLGAGTTCVAATPSTVAVFYSVIPNAAVTIPTPLPGPSPCPVPA